MPTKIAPATKAARKLLRQGETVEPRLTAYHPHHPHPRQALFLSPPVTLIEQVFFGGAAGGGKSEALLMAALQYVDVPGYQAVIVRKNYPMLNQDGGLIKRAHAWLDDTDATWHEGKHRWTFPSGATLSFRHLTNDSAIAAYQGSEYSFIGVDEVTDLSLHQYREVMVRLRSTVDSPVPLRIRMTSNPRGPGVKWVHRRFVAEGAVEKGRLFIPSRLEDNPSLDRKSYDAVLRKQGNVIYQQLRWGNWDIGPEGMTFKRADLEDNVIKEAELPDRLQRLRYWDLAATEVPKGKKARDMNDPDYTVGLLLARGADGKYFVEDVARGQWSPETIEKVIGSIARNEDGKGVKIRMEQEPGAAGKIVGSHYRRQVLDGFDFGMIPSSGSKEVRASLVAARVEAGDVSLVEGEWVEEFVDELAEFPNGLHDDQVDALSGAYNALSGTRTGSVVTPVSATSPNYWGE